MVRKELPQAPTERVLPVRAGPTFAVTPLHVDGSGARPRSDAVATEEPLEIRIRPAGGPERALSVTMRTPGSDFELAVGFLTGEGIVRSRADVERVQYCVGGPGQQEFNIVTVLLRPSATFDAAASMRAFPTTSACGVCGKATLEDLAIRKPPEIPRGPVIDEHVLKSLPRALRERQRDFDRTGGMHAAGLFDPSGKPVLVREDVGRHNAVDKVVGALVLEKDFPAGEKVLQLSGRASYEILQKALMSGISFVSAVGAPSSLAVQMAREFGITLAGFVTGESFNLYAGAERVSLGR